MTQEKAELQNQLKNLMNGVIPAPTPEQNGKSKKVNRANSTPASRKSKDSDDDFREQDNEAALSIINELKSK